LIRNFIFRHTLPNIKQKTLIQDKLRGGISLQDIKIKTEALRIKFVGEIIKQPQSYPLAHYYIGTYISKLHKPNNSAPHFIGTLPVYYQQCIDALKGHEHLTQNKTTDIYKLLVLNQAPPLQRRIKVGHKFFITDHSNIFRDIHCNHLSIKAREVTYRLIFNMTPLTKFNVNGQKLCQCKLCRQNIQEDEDHIFFKCPTIAPAHKTLRTIIQKHTKIQVDMYQAIMLNMLPKMEKTMKIKLLRCLGEFRLLVWTCRNKAVHENKFYNREAFHCIFQQKVNFILA
jgi:hypothetical protein